MKVKELRELFQNYIDILDNYEDEQEVKMVSNTYFLSDNRYFLGIAGYDGGYISLSNLEEEILDLEEDEDEY